MGRLLFKKVRKSTFFFFRKVSSNSPNLEVAVWSQPYGRHRGPLPRRRRSRAPARDTFAASASSRRTFRYNSVEKRAVFGPETVGRRMFITRSIKGERGCVPLWRRLRPFPATSAFIADFGKASSTTTSGVIDHRRGNADAIDDFYGHLGPCRPTFG